MTYLQRLQGLDGKISDCESKNKDIGAIVLLASLARSSGRIGWHVWYGRRSRSGSERWRFSGKVGAVAQAGNVGAVGANFFASHLRVQTSHIF